MIIIYMFDFDNNTVRMSGVEYPIQLNSQGEWVFKYLYNLDDWTYTPMFREAADKRYEEYLVEKYLLRTDSDSDI